jgi:hypothetical protein
MSNRTDTKEDGFVFTQSQLNLAIQSRNRDRLLEEADEAAAQHVGQAGSLRPIGNRPLHVPAPTKSCNNVFTGTNYDQAHPSDFLPSRSDDPARRGSHQGASFQERKALARPQRPDEGEIGPQVDPSPYQVRSLPQARRARPCLGTPAKTRQKVVTPRRADKREGLINWR